MTNFQPCNDASDVLELSSTHGLFLKPIAKINISVQLPQFKNTGKSISNWEVMEKIKGIAKPHSFFVLKVVKSTLEFIRFEGETENKNVMKLVLAKLDSKTIKISGYTEPLKVKTAEAKLNFPTRHDWDSYFRDAKNVNEMEPGERPDTIHFQGLPSRWFSDPKLRNRNVKDEEKPCEVVLKKIFETFGQVCCVDIPMLDPYRCENHRKSTIGSIPTFSFGQDLTFEAFVQYRAYMDFVNAMDSLRGMKLMFTDADGKSFTAIIKVDFDKTKHLSKKSIDRRQIEREKLISLEKEREARVMKERLLEKQRMEEERKKREAEELERSRKRKEKSIRREERLKAREEKRRLKKIEKKQIEEMVKKEREIALEERKLLLGQRRLQSVRLMEYLFRRAEQTKVKEDLKKKELELEKERLKQLKALEEVLKEEQRKKEIADQKIKQQLVKQEELLKWKLLDKMKKREEKHQEERREKLRKELSSRRSKLKSVLSVGS